MSYILHHAIPITQKYRKQFNDSTNPKKKHNKLNENKSITLNDYDDK